MSVEVIGHRGARGLMPENSLPGFEQAIRLGVDAIELDVGVSADLEVVVHHDLQLNSDITRDNSRQWINEPGAKICDLTVAQLKNYDVGRIDPSVPYHQDFPEQKGLDDVKIPTLSELAKLIAELEFEGHIYIEAKRSPSKSSLTVDCKTFANAFVTGIQQLDIGSIAVVKSFDWNVLNQIRAMDPSIPLSPISSTRPGINNIDAKTNGVWTGGPTLTDSDQSIPKLIDSCGFRIWSSDQRDLDQATVAEAKAKNLKVITWTVNQLSDMQRMIDLGVDGVVTDYPDKLIKLLNREN